MPDARSPDKTERLTIKEQALARLRLTKMAFHENLDSFAGKKIKDFESGQSLENPAEVMPRVSWDWDSEHEVTDLLGEIFRDPQCEQLTGLVVGHFSEESYEEPPSAILNTLIQAAPRLPNLTTFFLGDMSYEQNEVSWIYHTDMSPFWEAFPQLQHVGIRGSNGLILGAMELPDLETLVLESGGMPSSVIQEVLRAKLPLLKHLEIYLGDEYYGWDGNADTVRPLLFENPFPNLEYLGLRNSEITDDICKLLVDAPIVGQLKTLDLSLGTLSDEGAKALLRCPTLGQLEKLDLHHHYLSGGVAQQLRDLGIDVNLQEAEGPSEEDRYVVHSE